MATAAPSVAALSAATATPSAAASFSRPYTSDIQDIGPGMIDSELLALWNSETDLSKRDRIIQELERRSLFPSNFQTEWERNTGAYPSLEDPSFIPKLLKHREFSESKVTTWKPRRDVCTTTEDFEITPVQRFVANFMSPRSPYMSMLLYHGVGVGKTCAAVQIAEAWLDNFPRSKVIIVAPPTIQSGFYRTIFDITRVKIGQGDEPNSATQCTGDLYLNLAGVSLERDVEKIEKRIKRVINKRYSIYGYREFANVVRDLLKRIPADVSLERKNELENKILNSEFGGKLMIIDEAHNLRDVGELPTSNSASSILEISEPGAAGENAPSGGEAETDDTKQGKILTPYLEKVLTHAEGMKLTLLTATPMYNTYREIIFIFKLLLMNDKKAALNETDIFTRDGNFRPGGEEKLGRIAQRYVSFMRGENPQSFPLRLYPFPGSIPILEEYPPLSPRGIVISPEEEKDFIKKLPIVPLLLRGNTLAATLYAMNTIPSGMGGLNYMLVEKLVSSGNFVVPPLEDHPEITIASRSEALAWQYYFKREMVGGELKFTPKMGQSSINWLRDNLIGECSQKFEFFLEKLRNSEGVLFAYTRYVNSGAIPLALVLEANGYTPYGRKTRLLNAPILSPGGRQCSLCKIRETFHQAESHAFKPAYYALITGDKELGIKNVDSISAERDNNNINGEKIKVIIGSQVAAEGVDFKYIREIHVMDSWYHLNRIEQIIGRGIRFCSHSALSVEKRNTTVYLYASVLPREYRKETGDLYSYRVAFKKGQQIGRVSRVMKQYAIDCNLNHDAIIINDSNEIDQIDSQKIPRKKVPIRDMNYTAICDWLECNYECIPKTEINIQTSEDTTYDAFSARWRVSELKKRIRSIFTRQTFYRTEDLLGLFADVPQVAYLNLLRETINNRGFKVQNQSGVEGYIRYCNGYYVFQPYSYTDIRIPLSIRAAKFPVKKDEYIPTVIEEPVKRKIVPTVATSAEIGRVPLPYSVSGVLESKESDEESTSIPASASASASTKPSSSIIDILPNVKYDYKTPWYATKGWIERLIEGSTSSTDLGICSTGSKKLDCFPSEIREWTIHVAKENNAVIIKLTQILQVVVDFIKAWRRSGAREPVKTRNSLLNYFWDNWLTIQEQVDAVYKNLDGATERFGDSLYKLGAIDVLRVLSPINGEIEYYCRDRRPCTRAIRDEIERNKTHPTFASSIISESSTGFLYGFLAPKESVFVFKTNSPPKTGEKLGRGSECGIVSTTRDHKNKIDRLFAAIESADLGHWSKDSVNLENSVRACTFLELTLRWMNEIRLNRKIWFYRPVQAKQGGHKGLFRS